MSGPSMSSKLLKIKLIAKGQLKLWTACFLIGVCVFLLLNNSTIPTNFFTTDQSAQRNFGVLIAQLAGTSAAVLVTCIALAFALPARPLLSDMRNSGHFLDLCATLTSAIVAAVIVMMLAIILASANAPTPWIHAVFASLIPLALMLFQASIRFFITMVALALPS